jgi:hypothetical protein
MLSKHIIPDQDTYIALFKACAMIGDVKTAFNGLAVITFPKFDLHSK